MESTVPLKYWYLSHPRTQILKFKTATEEPTSLYTPWKHTQVVVSLGSEKGLLFFLIIGFFLYHS
jgi:hypothetical protein